jgi:acetyl esterase
MVSTPREKQLTAKQIQMRMAPLQLLNRVQQKVLQATHRVRGTELFLETEAGRVRVLAYNLETSERLPLFVDIHGGGFCLGNAEMDDPFMPEVAEKAGVKIINVDYSLAPRNPFPRPLEECYAAVRYAKDHPDEFGIDASRIAVGGHSAGGNLSAAICLLDHERKELAPKALVLDYPVLDLSTDPYLKPRPQGALSPRLSRLFDRSYSLDREAAKNPLISPVFAAPEELKSFPPTLMISASQDSLAAEEAVFKDKLESVGVSVTYKLFQGAKHGFTLFKDPAADEAWQMMIDHLRWHLG